MHSRLIAALTTATATVALAACGSGEDSAPKPKPLPLTAHVVPASGLAGFKGTGSVIRQDAAAFAKAHNKTTAEVEKLGVVAGATAQFKGASSGSGNAMSIAEELGSEAAASKEADRLYRSNSKTDPGVSARAIDVPGIPGAKAVELTGKHAGQRFTGVEVVFAHGKVTHELFALGLASDLSVSAVLAAARSLYDRVKGHPLAQNTALAKH
jgi:hypothetical protein